MTLKTTVIGAYPKIGEGLDGQELRRALHRHDRGEIGDADLDKVFDEVTRATIGEIEAAGVETINDGQIRWDDLLAPFARSWSGVEAGPLERFYDNNTYYRQPVITGPISTEGRSFVRDFTFARGVAKARLKAAVPGPLTFATLTARDDHYRSLEERVLAVADAIGKEIAGLSAAGAHLIDIEDPAVVAAPRHIELAREAYRRLAGRGHALALVTYFLPPDAVLESLASFPVGVVESTCVAAIRRRSNVSTPSARSTCCSGWSTHGIPGSKRPRRSRAMPSARSSWCRRSDSCSRRPRRSNTCRAMWPAPSSLRSSGERDS